MVNHVKLSSWLLQSLQNGEAILFLGAGATIGASRFDGKKPLSGEQLRDLIADTFLDGTRKTWSLDRVADYAKNVSSLQIVQEFIKEQFEPLQPADFHCFIPKFRWRAIVTTNYDLIVERAYEKVSERLQSLAPIIRDGDNFSKKLTDPNRVPYLKLHGCVSVINDPELPLILASEEYAKHEKNRRRLFAHLKEWGHDHPIIFCGYEVADPNIQHILFDLADKGVSRPSYALVRPNIDDFDETVWRSRRFETVKATFEEFLQYLDGAIPLHARVISALRTTDQLPISRWFATRLQPSKELVNYLETEVRYVFDGMPMEGALPKDFYRGLSNSWGVFQQELDVRRKVTDDLIVNCLSADEGNKPVCCFLLKGHAGSGKDVTLRRVAWEAACKYEQLVLYLREGGVIRGELLRELHTLVQRRIVFFISDATKALSEVLDLIKFAKKENIRLTLVFGARTNEWNVYGEELTPEIDGEHDLRDLSESEVVLLLKKLELHSCLGHLENLTAQQRMDVFKLNAERQLLVALHEATSGKRFEDLAFDEYKNIVPAEARVLYLDICTLHRLRATVRAGLISRISGISFENFRNNLLKPLEHVVRIYKDKKSRDFVYRSRHPLIAKFVFEQALTTPEARANQIIRMLRYMNVDYQTDEEAFGRLIRGRDLAEIFADWNLGNQIYKVAQETGAPLTYVAHQRAIFELNHPNGSTRRAMDSIREAENNAKMGFDSLAHTRANILRRMALDATNALERDKCRQEAKEILRRQLQRARDPYPFSGLGQIILDEIQSRQKEILTSEPIGENRLPERILTDLISEAEDVISRGLQNHPGDEYLLLLQVNLSKILQDEPKASQALEIAFKTNPRSDVIASHLAQYYFRNNKREEAEQTLKKCLENNPNSKRIHLELARIYIAVDERAFKSDISHHLKRSFTQGDTNYDAQQWYARHEFLYGDRNQARLTFENLKSQKFPPVTRTRRWGAVQNHDGSFVEYRGRLETRYDSFCFANIPALGASIFIHYSAFDQKEWEKLTSNTPIRCHLAFTMQGPSGFDASIAG